MKRLDQWIPIFATALLCGCLQVQDELTVAPDGSGKVALVIHCNVSEELINMIGNGMAGGGAPVYPPMNEDEAQQFFPSRDFTLKVEQKNTDEGRTVTVEASFKDVNKLLASPYGRAHQLVLRTNSNGSLSLRALIGGSALAQAAQIKPDGRTAQMELPGLEEARSKKGQMRFEFRVNLPSNVIEANGTHENQSVRWAVERAKCKTDEEFATSLGNLLEASCTARDLSFSPASPPRLGLVPFDQLAEGKAATAGALPDTNQILSAARFVPYFLRVIRSIDLTGEGGGQPSLAQLTGALILPAALAPQGWGQVQLEEVIDAKGNNLMPKQNAGAMQSAIAGFESLGWTGQPRDQTDESAPQPESADRPRTLSISFKAPEWKIKTISKVKGFVELQYLGGSEVVKLSNAIPANLIMDMTKGGLNRYSFDSDRGQISNKRLNELGLSMRVQMASVESGMTSLSLEAAGKAALLDAQVFDSRGLPWPTSFSQSAAGPQCQIMVAGQPKPPLSLALTVGGVGASVTVPILLKNLPVGGIKN